jgi:hypothetical protein
LIDFGFLEVGGSHASEYRDFLKTESITLRQRPRAERRDTHNPRR